MTFECNITNGCLAYTKEGGVSVSYSLYTKEPQVLLPTIEAHATPWSIIYSDGWAAYRQFGTCGYPHEVVTHDDNCVDPVMRVHINDVEAYWSCPKQSAMYDSQLLMIPSYLDEVMWRECYGQHTATSFAYMLRKIVPGIFHFNSIVLLFHSFYTVPSYFLFVFRRYTAQHTSYNVPKFYACTTLAYPPSVIMRFC